MKKCVNCEEILLGKDQPELCFKCRSYNDFIKGARDAGFTDDQVNFLWEKYWEQSRKLTFGGLF